MVSGRVAIGLILGEILSVGFIVRVVLSILLGAPLPTFTN